MASNDKIDGMLTVREVARLLNVHPNTVRRWSERGIIKACHISRRGDRRFDREEVASFLEELNMSKGNLEVVARIRGQVKIRVLIVDKQASSFRNRLIHALSREPGLDLMDSEPGYELMPLIETHAPEVLLLDVDQPSLSGLELGRRVLRHFPRTKVVMLSPHPNDNELFEVVKSGAVAYLSKGATAEELVRTIKQAVRGEYPINDTLALRPKAAARVLREFQNLVAVEKDMEAVAAPLTYKEIQVLNCIASGKTNKQIAENLHISEQTVKNYVSSILRKLNANARAQAVALAIRSGWLHGEKPSSK